MHRDRSRYALWALILVIHQTINTQQMSQQENRLLPVVTKLAIGAAVAAAGLGMKYLPYISQEQSLQYLNTLFSLQDIGVKRIIQEYKIAEVDFDNTLDRPSGTSWPEAYAKHNNRISETFNKQSEDAKATFTTQWREFLYANSQYKKLIKILGQIKETPVIPQ